MLGIKQVRDQTRQGTATQDFVGRREQAQNEDDTLGAQRSQQLVEDNAGHGSLCDAVR